MVTQVNKLGIFAEFGPVNAFVSKHQMSSDMEFQEQSIPQKYMSRDAKIAIQKGDEADPQPATIDGGRPWGCRS